MLFTSFTGAEEKVQFQPTENGYQICRMEGRDYFVSYATHSAFGLSYTMYLPFDSVARSLRLLNALTFAVAVLAILVNTLFAMRNLTGTEVTTAKMRWAISTAPLIRWSER